MKSIDLIRREAYLNRFSWHAQDYPCYVRVKRDLRTEITRAAKEIGMSAALASLGHPRTLAWEYINGLRSPHPRWSTATWWAGIGLIGLSWLAMAYAFGAMDTLAARGGGTVSQTVFGTLTTFTYTTHEVSTQLQFTWWSLAWIVGVTVIPYLIGARVWRLFPSQVRTPLPSTTL